jgi:holin-like protein
VNTYKQRTFNALYSMFAILSCLALGKLCAFAAPFLPSSLYGLIIFTLTLHVRVFNAERIKSSVVWGLKHMGVCFVPAGVGIMNHFELIRQFGITIVMITFVTTFLLLTIVGLHYQRHAADDE